MTVSEQKLRALHRDYPRVLLSYRGGEYVLRVITPRTPWRPTGDYLLWHDHDVAKVIAAAWEKLALKELLPAASA